MLILVGKQQRGAGRLSAFGGQVDKLVDLSEGEIGGQCGGNGTVIALFDVSADGGSVEMHIYPDGNHGVGYAIDGKPSSLHNRDWIEQLIRWLKYNGIYN